MGYLYFFCCIKICRKSAFAAVILLVWLQEGRLDCKGLECWYAVGGYFTGDWCECRTRLMVPVVTDATSVIFCCSTAAEWFTILVPAYLTYY